jgi:hypothetical protein
MIRVARVRSLQRFILGPERVLCSRTCLRHAQTFRPVTNSAPTPSFETLFTEFLCVFFWSKPQNIVINFLDLHKL